MIPRIQGKVGRATEPEEMNGKYFFELFLNSIGGGEGESMGTFGPWDTEEEAHIELRKAAKLACEAIEKSMDGRPSGKYIDMKTNTVRKWDRSDEQ